MLFTHENTNKVIDMSHVTHVDLDHKTLRFVYDGGKTETIDCQTDYIAEELHCLLAELSGQERASLWAHEYRHPQLGYVMEHLMGY